MVEKAPPILFTYRGLSADFSRERETILENKIWFSTPDGLNDPFEARPISLGLQARPPRKEMMRQATKTHAMALKERARVAERREYPVEIFQASLGKGRYEIVVERIG